MLLFGVLIELLIGLLIGLFFGLFFGLLIGLRGSEIEMRPQPNQGIRRSARNGLIFGLFVELLGGLLVGVLDGLLGGLSGRVLGGLLGFVLGGLLVGLSNGLDYGVRAVLQHYTLRWLLARNGGLPFRDRQLIPFLDYCAGRIFLRKVGGGYIFVHRLLMEHFARMDA